MDILNNKKIFIAGGRGFIGQALSGELNAAGYDVNILSRSEYQSNPTKLAGKIDGCFAVINLAGATINKAWTTRYKKEILESRIISASTITQAINLCNNPPERFISTSAVGIYDTTHVHNEQSAFYANDFLAAVCKSWEAAPAKVPATTKLIIIRLGVVLGMNGGMLKKLKPLFKLCLGGRMGSGHQAFSYIHIKDLCSAIQHILKNTQPADIYNLTTPETISNFSFTKALARALHRPSFFVIPAFMLKIFFGERSDLFLKGQKVIPENLLKEDFKFRFPDVNQSDFFQIDK